MADCFNKSAQAYDSVDKESLAKLAAQIQEIKATASSPMDYNQRVAKVFENIDIESRQRMQAKIANVAALRREAAYRGQGKLIESPKTMFESYVKGGALGTVKDGGVGVRAEAESLQRLLFSDFSKSLEDSGALKEFMDNPKFQAKSAKIAEALSKAPNSDVITKASPLELSAGKAIRKFYDSVYEYKRANNIPVGRHAGYVGRQGYSVEKLKAAGYENFATEVVKVLDHEATFGAMNLKERAEYLKKAYSDIVDGRSEPLVSDETQLMTYFEKRQTLGASDRSRKFIFQDAEKWFEFNQKFGRSENYLDIMHGDAYQAGIESGMVARFGVNAQKGMVDFRNRIQSQAKQELKANPNSTKAQKAFREAQEITDEVVRKEFDRIAGTGGPVSENMVTKIAEVELALNRTRFLGGSVLSSIPDIGVSAITIKNARSGRSFGEAAIRALDYFKMSAGNSQDFMRRLGVAADDTLSFMRFNDGEPVKPGVMQTAGKWMHKLSGMEAWTKNIEGSVVLSQANDLHAVSGTRFSELQSFERNALSRVGIESKHWDLIRLAKEEHNGRGFITNSGLDNLPDSVVKDVMTKNGVTGSASQFKIDTRRRLSSFYNDIAALGSTRPDEFVRGYSSLGFDPKSAKGAVARLIMQFKSYPLQFFRNIGRFATAGTNHHSIIESFKTGQFQMNTLAQLTLSNMALAYLGMSAKRLASNQTPDDLSKKETWMRVMQQSGMLGIVGDVFMGEYVNRSGGSAIAGLLGPAAGDIDKILGMYGAAYRGEEVGGKLYNFGRSMIPGGNLFYLKSAFDYAIGYNVQEALNPGSVLRYEQNVTDQGREFLFGAPTEAL